MSETDAIHGRATVHAPDGLRANWRKRSMSFTFESEPTMLDWPAKMNTRSVLSASSAFRKPTPATSSRSQRQHTRCTVLRAQARADSLVVLHAGRKRTPNPYTDHLRPRLLCGWSAWRKPVGMNHCRRRPGHKHSAILPANSVMSATSGSTIDLSLLSDVFAVPEASADCENA